jgi:hypothetical protein
LLPLALTTEAAKLYPKPEIDTLTLNLKYVKFPELKLVLNQQAPDVIILNPPAEPANEAVFGQLIKELTRYSSIMSAKIMLMSSVEVLGDTTPRSEVAIPLPNSEMGTFLRMAETRLETETSRYYIFRLPYTLESPRVKEWLSWTEPAEDPSWPPRPDTVVTFASIPEVAPIVLERIQSGWYGKYHVTPNDSVSIRYLISGVTFSTIGKVTDNSLASKYTWALSPTPYTWFKWTKKP